jgi:putative effector of murein hydrolase LrgA (UPF0299 family)
MNCLEVTMKALPRRWTLIYFPALCAVAGAVLSIIVPPDWIADHFASWYTGWLIAPTTLLFLAICVTLHIDAFSNAADPTPLMVTYAISGAIVSCLYALLIGFVYRAIGALLSRRANTSFP